MSCYAPLKRFIIGTNPNTGKTEGRIFPFDTDHLEDIGSALVPSSSPEIFNRGAKIYRDYQEIPCGYCEGCKMAHAKEWADRLLMEYTETKKALFITLSYNEENVVWNGDKRTLCKKDGQDFLKRLRDHFYPRKLRFYLCGEYGELTFRPHMHLVVFGIDLDDFEDKKIYKITKLGFVLYESEKLNSIWSNGYAPFSAYSYRTGAYVARYITKKQKDPKIFYEALNVLPPYATMSLKPGIGSAFYEKHKEEYLHSNKLYVSDSNTSIEVGFPRYLKMKLEEECPEGWLERKAVLADRRMFAEDMEMAETDLDRQSYLDAKRQEFIRRTKKLKLSEFE